MKIISIRRGVGILFLFYSISVNSQFDCELQNSQQIPISSISNTITNNPNLYIDKSMGEIVWENGATYEGHISNQKMNGQGTLVNPKQFTYNGDFKNDMFHGQGKIIFEDGTQYEGKWQTGKKNGYGAFVSSCGFEYLGNFQNDLMHGEGVMRLSETESYSGSWKEGKLNGKATHYLADGSFFEGNFEEGIKNGLGSLIWENGDTMTAIWKDGVILDKSHFNFADGSQIIQLWENGKLKNQAIYIQSNGLNLTGSPEVLANLVSQTSLIQEGSIENNFSLAWYSAALEYKNQNNFDGAIEQLTFAQYFQDPFDESEISNLVNNEIEFVSKEKEKVRVARKENKTIQQQ